MLLPYRTPYKHLIQLYLAGKRVFSEGRSILTVFESIYYLNYWVSSFKCRTNCKLTFDLFSTKTLHFSVQKHLTFYNAPELDCLEDYLIYGLKHSKRLIRVTTAKFWNSSFGIKHTGHYSEKLRSLETLTFEFNVLIYILHHEI